MNFQISIDTGGTFTDAISADDTGHLITVKVSTTPKDLTIGFRDAIQSLARLNGMATEQYLPKVNLLVHGTTQGTNTILTRTGTKVGIMHTKGFKHVLQLRRVVRESLWKWRQPCPEPLSPPYLWTEVDERIGARGEIISPLDEETVRNAIAYFKKLKVESIVISLLFSFLNPEHEKKVAKIIRSEYPEAHVTLSSEIAPVIGEYERTSTAVISSYIAAPMAKYIQKLEEYLEESGFTGQLLFMQNNGGVESSEIGKQKPATLALSGPAAGPASALMAAQAHGFRDIMSVDMGGTSFDCTIIDKGNLTVRNESLIAEQRFSLPVIDAECIGSGGGSIAWFDPSGTLRVGPQSAGGDPGPACYNRGGQEPTVTDAWVALGYIAPDYFLGGEMKLRKDLAEKAIKEKVADRLGMTVQQAAAAIHKVSYEVMADAVSHIFTRRGYDPRDFVLSCGGAAGPVCVLEIAKTLSISRVLIPRYSPNYCAFGMLGVDLVHDFTRFYLATKETIDLKRLTKLYAEMEAEGLKCLKAEGIRPEHQSFVRSMEIRYYGQFRNISVNWPNGPITEAAIAEGVANFHRKHKELRGHSDENFPISFLSFGLSAIGKVPKVRLEEIERGSEDVSAAIKGQRKAHFEETNGAVKVNVYNGDKLVAGNVLEGPCIVEERMTNVVVPPAFSLHVDQYGTYLGTMRR